MRKKREIFLATQNNSLKLWSPLLSRPTCSLLFIHAAIGQKKKKTSTRLSHPRYFNVDLLWAYTKTTDGHKIRIDQCPVLISPLEFRPERSPLPLISLIFFCNDMLFLAIDLTCSSLLLLSSNIQYSTSIQKHLPLFFMLCFALIVL